MKFFKKHKAKETTGLNIGIRECRTCENNIRCEECAYPKENEMLKAEIERLNKEVDVLTQQIMKPFHEEREKCIKCEKELKSEAIKELIGRLEYDYAFEIPKGDGYLEKVVRFESIKNVAKEMVGK